MNKKLILLSTSAVLLALPLVMFAIPNPPVPPGNGNLDAIQIVNLVLSFLWPFFIGFAVIMFIVAGFLFLSSQGDPGKTATARSFVIWGIIGVAIGVLAFSIPYVVLNQLM